LPSPGIVIDRRTLFQCVVLSMLLHLWIVLLFGTTTYNGARGDRGFGDVFDVTLRALTEESGPGFRLAPGADTASPGTALLPRAGSRATAPKSRDLTRPTEPAAPQPAPDASARETTSPVTEISPPPANAAPTITPPAVEPLPRLNLDAPEVVDKPYVPATPPPPIEQEVAPPVPVLPRDVVPPPVPIERIAPPLIERESPPIPETEPRDTLPPPPVEMKSGVIPTPPPAEVKPRDVPPPPAPVETSTPPALERDIVPAPETKSRAAPVVPAVPAERAPTPKIEAEPAPPILAPPPVAGPEPVTRPEASTPTLQRDVSPPAAPVAPTTAPAPRSSPSETAPRPAEGVAPETRSPPRTDGAPAESPPRLGFGAPEPDEDMFKPRRDVVTPPIDTGGAPRIDLDEAKKRAASAVVREGSGSRGLLPVVPPPPEREAKDARPLEKAVKPDCRTAYANMGLLAAVPLVASAIGDSGCRW